MSKYPHQGGKTVCSAYGQTRLMNHVQTVCTSKDKAQSRNTSRLDENKVYDVTSSARDKKHSFSLSTRQSSKNQPCFLIKSGDIRVWGAAVLRYYWRGFAKLFILSCGIAVFQHQVIFVFYQLGKFRCAICGILLFSVQFCRFQGLLPPNTPLHNGGHWSVY